MNNALSLFCEHLKLFKSQQEALVVDEDFKLVYVSQASKDFFALQNLFINEGDLLFEIIKHQIYFQEKKLLYEFVKKNKKSSGYFIAQKVGTSHNLFLHMLTINPITCPIRKEKLIGLEILANSLEELPNTKTLINKCDLLEKNNLLLTNREREIIFLKSIDKTNLEISQILNQTYHTSITEKTINNITLQQIYRKLNVTNKQALATKTQELGLDKFIPKSLITKNVFVYFKTVVDKK